MSECSITMCCEAPDSWDPDAFACRLPAANEREAAELLEIVGSGGSLGTGGRLSRLGVDIPLLRGEYELAARQLATEVEARRAAGMSQRQIADWVVQERARVARRIRLKHGVGQTVLFEIRDWSEYGVGGRTVRNMRSRYTARGFRGSQLDEALIRGALKPNHEISAAARQGARYLRHGGRVIVVVSVATTAYVLLTTPPDQLEQVLFQEAGGIMGGSAGAGLGVGVCLVFGIATGGWGLLACGIVGGAAGGALGSYAGNEIYYHMDDQLLHDAETTGLVDGTYLRDAGRR